MARPGETPPLRILLAEDNPISQKVALALLHKKGHSVRVAATGQEVLMPEMDGLQATAALRRSPCTELAQIKIVAMTAHAMQEHKQMCLSAGMDAYASKPISPGSLYVAIRDVLSQTPAQVS